MTREPHPNDAKVTVPLRGAAPQPERETLPLPGAAPDTADGDARSTVPLADDIPEAFPVDEPVVPALPQKIGRFAVRAWLGSGAFGDVYRAHDPQLDREVALKVAKPGTLDTPERVGRFLREAKSAANLRHPNIVPLYETGRDGDRLFIATAFISGRTLEAVIQEADDAGQPIPLDTAAQVVRKLADALAYAHAQGIVHRDVKPANVMIDEQGEPHLLDFGLAARAEEGAERLTQDGQGMGTPAYMAPEQADGSGIAASDQYSLGCTLYELLTGRTPFAGGPAQQLFLHKTQLVPAVRAARRVVPRDLDTVVARCVEKESDRRYGSCAELAEDLRRFLAREPVKARRIGPVERLARWAKRNPVVASSISFAVLALLTGTIVSLAQADEAKWQAKLAKDAEANEAGQKKIADAKADEALKEAKRANDNKNLADDETAKAKVEAAESFRRLDLSRLREATTAFDRNLVGAAQDTLALVAPGNRCVAWGLLSRRFEGSLFTLYDHAGHVDMSADGSRVFTTRVWDGRTGQTIAELNGLKGAPRSKALSANGTVAVVGDDNGTLRVWDAGTGEMATAFPAHTGQVTNVALSADGARAVTLSGTVGSQAATVRVWDARTGQLSAEFKLDVDASYANLALSADGTRIVTSLLRRNVQVWDARTGQVVSQLAKPIGAMVGRVGVAISADGSRVVTGVGGLIEVWDARTGQTVAELRGHTGEAYSVAVSADGARVVTASSDGTVRVWDARAGYTAPELVVPGAVSSVAVSADGARVVTASSDNVTRVWDARTGQTVAEFREQAPSLLKSVAVSADGARVVTASDLLAPKGSGKYLAEMIVAHVWDVKTGQAVAEFKDIKGTTQSVAMSADGSRAATLSHVRLENSNGPNLPLLPPVTGIQVWDTRTGQAVTGTGFNGSTTAFALTPDGSRMVTGGGFGSGDVVIWDANTGKNIRDFQLGGQIQCAAVSADGSRIVTGSFDKTARVLDASTGQTLAVLNAGGVSSVVISADGLRVITDSVDKTIRVWDARTGQMLVALDGHKGGAATIATSADGLRVAAVSTVSLATSADGLNVSAESRVRVWDARPDPTTEFQGHTAQVSSVEVSADGSRVVTLSRDGAARLWDARTGQTVAELKGDGGSVSGVKISDDGSRVVTWMRGNVARLWDARTGRSIAELRGRTPGLQRIADAISTDGSRVITVWRPATTPSEPYPQTSIWVGIWDARTGSPLTEYRLPLDKQAQVSRVAVSNDGTRLLAYDRGQQLVFDASAGRHLVGEPIPLVASERRTVAGPYRFFASGNRAFKVSLQIDDEERRRRLWLTRPDPAWHARRQKELEAEGNAYGAALHRSFETRARGVVAADRGDRDAARVHRAFAGALLPPPPEFLELAPPPRPVDLITRAIDRERLALEEPWDLSRWGDAVRAWDEAGQPRQVASVIGRVASLMPWDHDIQSEAAGAWIDAGQPQRAALYIGRALLDPLMYPGSDRDVAWAFSPPGLHAELYAGKNFEKLVKTRTEQTLSWHGQFGRPDAVMPTDHFSIRWTGLIRAPVAGRYTLQFFADDGARVWIDDRLVIDEWRAPQRQLFRTDVTLTGRPQRLRIEYFENDGWASYELAWIRPGETQAYIIPSECLRAVAGSATRELAPLPREVNR